jgi:hypothetical protein
LPLPEGKGLFLGGFTRLGRRRHFQERPPITQDSRDAGEEHLGRRGFRGFRIGRRRRRFKAEYVAIYDALVRVARGIAANGIAGNAQGQASQRANQHSFAVLHNATIMVGT